MTEGKLLSLASHKFMEYQDATYLVNRKQLENQISGLLDAEAANLGDDRSTFAHPMIYWVHAYIQLTSDPEYHARKGEGQANF